MRKSTNMGITKNTSMNKNTNKNMHTGKSMRMNQNTGMKPGNTHELIVVKQTDIGVYLNPDGDANADRVLLPKKEVPEDTKIGDSLSVFLYKDSEDRLIATTAKPLLELGDVASLTVKDVTSIGAFLDWGLAKDLFLPFKEQVYKVAVGDTVLAALYLDKSERLCATMHVYDYLATDNPYTKGDMVEGTLYEIIDSFGAFVAVDNKYSALIPKKEFFQDIKIGESVRARVTGIREDGKLTLSLREKAYLQMDTDSALILDKLKAAGGTLPFHDKSSPEAIKKEFHLSKNAFKRALGRLLKEGKIRFTDHGISLR